MRITRDEYINYMHYAENKQKSIIQPNTYVLHVYNVCYVYFTLSKERKWRTFTYVID